MPRRRLVLSLIAAAVLVGALVAAGFASRADDWHALSLLGLLFVLASGSELLGFEIKGLRLSGSFLAIMLSAALVGPAPAVVLACGCTLFDAALNPRQIDRLLTNLAISATFSLAAGLMVAGLTDARYEDPLWFAAVVLCTFLATNTLNFLMVAAAARYGFGAPIR